MFGSRPNSLNVVKQTGQADPVHVHLRPFSRNVKEKCIGIMDILVCDIIMYINTAIKTNKQIHEEAIKVHRGAK